MDINGPLRILIPPGHRALEVVRGADAAAALALDADGSMSVGEGAAAPGIVPNKLWRPPTVGQFSLPAELCMASLSAASQQLNATLWVPERTQLVSNIQVHVGTAAGATPTVIRFGIYSIAGTTATQIIATPNDTTLLAAAGALSGRNVTTPGVVTRGVPYFICSIVVTGAALPTFGCKAGGAGLNAASQDAMYGSGLRAMGIIAAQSDLPASFTTTSLSTTVATPQWFWLQ